MKIEIVYDILYKHELGTELDFVGADGYYVNDLNFDSTVNRLGLIAILDIHSD